MMRLYRNFTALVAVSTLLGLGACQKVFGQNSAYSGMPIGYQTGYQGAYQGTNQGGYLGGYLGSSGKSRYGISGQNAADNGVKRSRYGNDAYSSTMSYSSDGYYGGGNYGGIGYGQAAYGQAAEWSVSPNVNAVPSGAGDQSAIGQPALGTYTGAYITETYMVPASQGQTSSQTSSTANTVSSLQSDCPTGFVKDGLNSCMKTGDNFESAAEYSYEDTPQYQPEVTPSYPTTSLPVPDYRPYRK